MRIILSRDIKNLGKVGDVVIVKDGYGRNYLLRKGYAVAATKSNISNLNSKLEQLKQKNVELTSKAEQISSLLNDTVYNLTRQASDDDTIYGSVRTRDVYNFIVDLIKNNNIDFVFDICGIKIAAPIKVLGRYIIDIEIFGSVAGKLRLNLCRVTADFDKDVATFDKKMEASLLSVKDAKAKLDNAEKVLNNKLSNEVTTEKQDSSKDTKTTTSEDKSKVDCDNCDKSTADDNKNKSEKKSVKNSKSKKEDTSNTKTSNEEVLNTEE